MLTEGEGCAKAGLRSSKVKEYVSQESSVLEMVTVSVPEAFHLQVAGEGGMEGGREERVSDNKVKVLL
jgi:hypothetical protein